jgi:Fe-S cluster biogenesis protein NfuA
MADRRLDRVGVENLIARFEDGMERVEQVPGPTAEAALDAVATLTALYGEALARVVDAADAELVHRLAADELVGHLMALHGLHPESVEERVRRVLSDVRPQLGEHGRAELSAIDDGVARIRIAASGCGSANSAQAVADAVLGEVPELAGVLPELIRPTTTIPVGSLLRRPQSAPR